LSGNENQVRNFVTITPKIVVNKPTALNAARLTRTWGTAMKLWVMIFATNSMLLGCANKPNAAGNDVIDPDVAKAEELIDAFCSFDRSRLNALLDGAECSKPDILYYQGWAEGGNYKIVNRKPCTSVGGNAIACPITVDDDLGNALRFAYEVTDTFKLTFSGGEITAVETSSDDPPEFYAAQEWVKTHRPELIEVPCQGYFAGGPTPGECVKAMVQGFREFESLQQSAK
jgi:hypothetical protein